MNTGRSQSIWRNRVFLIQKGENGTFAFVSFKWCLVETEWLQCPWTQDRGRQIGSNLRISLNWKFKREVVMFVWFYFLAKCV